jgi:hypothetical protein
MHRGEEKFNSPLSQGYVDPDHYKNRKYEVFDVMRDTQTYERHIGYLEGCVIKYMMRWDKKNDDPLMDLRKAKRYLRTANPNYRKTGGRQLCYG